MAFLTLLRRSPRLACSTLLGLAGCLSMLGAQAATIYQCKQADGKVTFQQVACAHTEAQAEVGKTTHAAPRPVAKPAAAVPAAANTSAAQRDPNICVSVGREVYSAIRQSHPQAAMQACKKHLEMFASNMACLQTCVETWVGEYKKHQAAP